MEVTTCRNKMVNVTTLKRSIVKLETGPKAARNTWYLTLVAQCIHLPMSKLPCLKDVLRYPNFTLYMKLLIRISICNSIVWSAITTITSAIHPKIALKTILSQIIIAVPNYTMQNFT